MKKVFKILLLIIILEATIFVSTSKAAFWSNIFSSADNFVQTGIDETQNVNAIAGKVEDQDLQAIINDLYNVLMPLGIAITVIVGGILGIKFMMASAEDKAKVKESIIPYVVGCFVIYGAFGIWKIAIEIFSALL